MNYNELILKECNFDTEFIDFIDLYQNFYKNSILEITPNQVAEKVEVSKKRTIKDSLEDFFFTPKYNILDILKLSKA
ncbi:hypothetical protein [Tenacibaculum finnmarkense]|uniref:Uncharacterized protein n=1 Tax=Tenacibaculum finnmarkense genomovar ulcerans TaxID=2781388 RepID=A0A2I2M8J4_9FLAO|nr:hypothetical protein [Tenacibaculum finnmarkense]ALU75668.1 hypothetical protein AUW17_10575 [Tenacibaculum dicentrarchi]MBE7633095.1 hypothetical protein [Tenacibaculum finnmarkense genomovar ulcerans]MBE7644749.1 hypothetical protein [Tenacibaculum finnmarkense genomovar ulcerans]MBE7686691.1 hypothetical protein [Tenacibaculum finnmarkense genomovar ulcerans]MBE7696943.1 hypothetical protein [Tenacibaculum finnmarkense genomovar ulcerans]